REVCGQQALHAAVSERGERPGGSDERPRAGYPGPQRVRPRNVESERLRVEDLARRAETSVDTIRFYQKRRLLPAPQREGRIAWYGPEHIERLARIRELRVQGLTLALIGRMVAGDLDPTDAPLAAAVAAADGEAETDEEFL